MYDKEILKYYEGIILLDNEEDIRLLLPSPDFPSFLPIMEGLIAKLKTDIANINEFIKKDTNPEEQDYYKQELKLHNLKLNICKEQIQVFKSQTEQLKEFFANTNKHIIFAKSNKGNILFERDLKYISKEYYKEVEECLLKLQEGIKEGNEEKAKKLMNNKALSGLHEIKAFKVRIVYRILDSNTIYVILAKMKKSDNESKDREELKDRKIKTNQEFESLKIKIKDENFKSKLIEENEETLKELRKTLKGNQR